MVSRTTKVIAAGLVLALGTGLAWPFRRTDELDQPKPPVKALVPAAATVPTLAEAISAPASVAASFAADVSPPRLAHRPVPLAPASSPPVAAPPAEAAVTIEPKPEVSAPAFVAQPLSPPEERIHIVHDGDTLERLARRYLGDESRALEIFDLNRGTLENPHWLPIGAELRLPPRAQDEEI